MKNSNRKSANKSAIIIIIMTLIIALGGTAPIQGFAETNGASDAPMVQPPAISAQNAIVIEQSTGKVLYEKNSRQKAYPASTTKIVTALLAFRQDSPGGGRGARR